jgi:hypothetical protein
LIGGGRASPCALRTGDKSLALALGTSLARSNDNPGFVAGFASAFACGTCHLSLSAATRTFHFVFAHRHPSLQPESLVNQDSQCSIRCIRRQIICDPRHLYHPAVTWTFKSPATSVDPCRMAPCPQASATGNCYLAARTRAKSRAPFMCIIAPAGLKTLPSKLANRS